MNLTVKRCLWFLVAGGGSGLIILAAFVLVGGMLNKGSLPHTILTRLFEAINKPLEIVPGLSFLAERQDPILSIGFIAVYWATIGILIGGVAFAISAFRGKAPSGSSGVPHKGS